MKNLMKSIFELFILLAVLWSIAGCKVNVDNGAGGDEKPSATGEDKPGTGQDTPVEEPPAESLINANSYFWGKWTRMDNGKILYVSEEKISFEGNEYNIKSSTSSLLSSEIGDISKDSENVAKLNDVLLFRSSAVNIPYTFTLVGFRGNSTVAQTLGEGYEVTASCSDFPSYKESVVSDSNGRVTLHSPVSKAANLVTVKAEDGTTVTATLTPNFADEDLGSLSVSENGKYALKVTGKVEDYEYLYAQTDYELTLSVENISEVIASNSVVELSSSDEHLELDTSVFNIASIAKGMKKTVSLKVRYKDSFKAPYVDTSIALKFTDARTENSWTDYVPLRIYGKQQINIKACNTENNENTSLNGFIMYPDGNGQQFSVKHNISGYLTIPLFPSPYKVVFGGAVIGETLSESTEMKYSLGVGCEANNVTGAFTVSEMNFAEKNGGNDTENTAYDVENSEKIKAYLYAGDVDFYKLSIYNNKIPYTVKHLKEQENGDFTVCETEELIGYLDGNTTAIPKNYYGYKAQAITQKKIENFGETVVEVKYDAQLTGIKITKTPSKTVYKCTTEAFSDDGIEVTANYGWGSKTVTEYTTDGDSVVTSGGKDKTVTVSYTYRDVTKADSFAINVAGHTEDSGTVTAPTCETKGVKTYKCTVCGEKTKEEDIPATGHTETIVIIEPTCVTKGVKTYKCTVCGEEFRTETFDALGWCETAVDSETYKKATSSSTYVYFGVFPKTLKASSVTVDVTDTVTMGANTYYKGSDGEWYAKVTANPYDSSYKYSDNTTVLKVVTYFKVEPIKWKVLTTDYNGTGKALLLAENILTANVPYYYYNSSSNTRTVGSDKNIYPNNYKYSQIRAYLNGLDFYYDTSSSTTTKKTNYTDKGFLQTAFTTSAQALIAETTVDNSAASTTDTGNNITKATSCACANTTDKIFLLSEKEVTTTAYGFAAYNNYGKDNSRIRVTTDYAKANYAYQITTAGYGGYWWLRSPYWYDSIYARYVNSDGSADDCSGVYNAGYGVVPALSISLQ